MGKVFKIKSLEEIDAVAADFINYISTNQEIQSNIFAFNGAMGAGKTTFIKALCRVLEVTDSVNSPTFTLVNEYKSGKGFPIYHFDFYRINEIKEAYDIGIDEYFGGDGLCFIEWPERIEAILPESCVRVDIREIEGIAESETSEAKSGYREIIVTAGN